MYLIVGITGKAFSLEIVDDLASARRTSANLAFESGEVSRVFELDKDAGSSSFWTRFIHDVLTPNKGLGFGQCPRSRSASY